MAPMKRRSRALPRSLPVRALLVPALLVPLAACGTERAGASGDGGTQATAPADPADLAARAHARGVAPEHVYVTDVPGHTLAQQSVGVIGDDGFTASYVSRGDGTTVQLTVDRTEHAAGACPSPVGGTDAAPCVRDGEIWYREGTGGHREYTVPKDDHVVRVGGDGVPRDVLRTAAEHVHRPTAAELDTLMPAGTGTGEGAGSVAGSGSGSGAGEVAGAGAGGGPVERGDLPPEGDGAPDNHVGTSG